MNQIIKDYFKELENYIVGIVRKKFPDIEVTENFMNDRSVYQKLKFRLINKESSCEELSPPYVTFTVHISYLKKNQKWEIDHRLHIDSVPVHYGRVSDKLNKRNITIGRAQYRRVDNWLNKQLYKKLERKPIATTSLNNAIDLHLNLLQEKTVLVNQARQIVRDLTGTTSWGKKNKHWVFKSIYNFTIQGRVFYFKETKVGTRSKLFDFIINNAPTVIKDFAYSYPLLANEASVGAYTTGY